jgi:hypothetical protein
MTYKKANRQHPNHEPSAVTPPSIEGSISKEATYRLAADVWKSQVDSSWTRSSYNAVFQLALGTGVGKVFEDKHWWTSLVLAVVALLLTAIWFLTSRRMNDYIKYYWDRLKELEESFQIPYDQQIFWRARKQIPESKIKYRYYVNAIPCVFGLGWVWVLGWCVLSLIRGY